MNGYILEERIFNRIRTFLFYFNSNIAIQTSNEFSTEKKVYPLSTLSTNTCCLKKKSIHLVLYSSFCAKNSK